MAKGKKSKTSERQARTIAKQGKKLAKGEKKAKAMARDARPEDDSDAEGEVDLDAVLAAYAEEQAKFLKVTEESCQAAPSPRSSATMLASPSNRNELFVFGGEYYDGVTARFFNDLFVYLIDRGEWRQVKSPNSPLPRSGHAWCRGGNAGGIYLFGGEFSSPKQGTFHHYNDFWHLDPTSREWTRIESKRQGPSARSGHRMTYFKSLVILFGGFQDTSQQTRYLQDLWIYDCQNYAWHEIKLAPASQRPDPRSSFSFLPHRSGAALYGGYSRIKTTSNVGKSAKASGPQRNVVKPLIHQDTWLLHVKIPDSASEPDSTISVRWERRKKPANPPNPARAGATMADHKGRGILFGGVHDVEESEEGIESEFFNTLFAWNTDRNRFFPLTLRRPKCTSRKTQVPSTRARDRGKVDEEELLRNLAALESKGSISAADDFQMVDPPIPKEEIEKTEHAVVRFELPHSRFNAQLTVQDDSLFILGGTFERGDKEFTFNDMYSIDLVKLDGVREIFFHQPDNWISEDESEQENEDETDSESSSQEEDTGEPMLIDEATAPAEVSPNSKDAEVAEEDETVSSAKDDSRPFPRPFESLREFFNRTSAEWQNILIANTIGTGGLTPANEASVKELRKKAFSQAEERWWDCREEIRVLEDEQEEAGIGEVINITERNESGAKGRR